MTHDATGAVPTATAPTVVAADQKMRPDDRGATAIEYGLLVGAIAAVIIAIVSAVGVQVDTALFDKVYDAMVTLPD